MSMTVEALAEELNRLDTLFPDIEWAPEALAAILLPFIERHLAAGQQGADADLLLTVAVELEAQARAEERKTPSDGDGPSALREWARKLRSLATPQPPKPAGDVPLPMFPIESEGSYWSTTEIEVIRAYGDAREAAAQHHVNLLGQAITDAAHKAGITRADAVIDGPMLLMLCKDLAEAAGRADAVPAWFGELPAPISNPEAWPANYAGGYNDALNMCYDVIRGHAPQPMTTQGEAVATVVESLANGHALEFHGGYSETLDALPIGTKLYTGSQP